MDWLRYIIFAILLFFWGQHHCSHAQTYFTAAERNNILERHKEKLANEALKIFDKQTRSNTIAGGHEIFKQMANYKGLYESLEIVDIGIESFRLDPLLVIGFDYKRHNNQHHLLYFSNTSLAVQAFVVRDRKIVFTTAQPAVPLEGSIRMARLYQDYESDRLFAIVLLRRGINSIKLFEIEDGLKLAERELKHEFRLHENVVAINVVRTNTGRKQRVVALIDAGHQISQHFQVEKDKEIIKVVMPGALHLRKLHIQSQVFLIFSNATHWGAFRYNDETEAELINLYRVKSPIVDIRTFSNGHRYYVAVACQNQQLIYQWKSKLGFRGVAKTYYKRVYKINAITISYARVDNFFYFDQYGSNTLTFFAYDITNSAFTNLGRFEKTAIAYPNVIFDQHYSSHFFDRDLAFELKLADAQIYLVSFKTTISQNPKRQVKGSIHNLQRYDKSVFEKRIDALRRNIINLERRETISKRVLNLNFTFDVEFRANVIVNRYESFDRKVPEKIIINNHVFENQDMLVPLPELHQSLSNVRDAWDRVNRILNTDVVFKSSNSRITGSKDFVNRIFVNRIQANEARIGIYKGLYVTNILANLYRTSKNDKITGRKTFLGPVSMNQFLDVKQINGINPEHFLYAQLDQQIDANLWYKQVHVDKLTIGDSLSRNVSFSRAILINQDQSPPITIQHRPLFGQLNAESLSANLINNVSISLLEGQLLKHNALKPQVFKVRVNVPTLHTSGDISCKTVNSFDISEALRRLIRKKKNGVFTKNVHFKGDVHINRLQVNGLMNRIELDKDLVNKYADQTIYGIKKFKQLSMNSLNATRINNLAIPDDIVTLTRDEHVRGKLTLDALRSDKDLIVHGLVDGVNTTHLDQKFVASLNNHFHNLTFYKQVNVNELKISSGKVNGFHLEEIYGNALFKNGRILMINNIKTFSNGFKCNNIEANMINGQKLTNFVTTNHDANFGDVVRFANFAQFGHVSVEDTIDGVKAAILDEDVFKLDTKQTVWGQFNFKDGIRVNQDIIVKGSINGRPVSDFMLYSRPQNISGPYWLKSASVNRLDAVPFSGLILHGQANGRNFSSFLGSIIDISKQNTLDAVLKCLNCSAARIETAFVNQQSFKTFMDTYLSKSQSQEIQADVNFKTLVRFGNAYSDGKPFAGVNFKQLKEKAIVLNGTNVFTKPMIIHGNLVMRNGKINANRFNGINITDFRHKVVLTNDSQPIKIQGNLVFNNGFDLHEDMSVNHLNGQPPEQLILTNTGNYRIQSNVRFRGRVIASNVIVKGLINGINLTDLDRSILKVNNHGEVLGSINLVTQAQISKLKVSGRVDGVHVNRQKLIMLNDEQHIEQLALDGPVHMNDNLIIMSHINGWHKDNLAKIVLTNSQIVQWINATKTFVHLEADVMEQMRGSVHFNLVNGHDLKKFQEEAIYSSTVEKTIKVSQHFVDNITIASRFFNIHGRVNGINLEHDVVRLDKIHQKITGTKTFDNVVFNEDVNVFGNVNGVQLNKVANRILYTYGNQNVSAPLVFKAPIFFVANSTASFINDVVPSQFVNLHQPQRLKGKVFFNNMVVEKLVTNKLINGLNLSDVAAHALYKVPDDADDGEVPREQIIQGELVINKATFNKDVQLEKLLNNIDLNVAVAKTKSKLDEKYNVAQVEQQMSHFANRLKQQIFRYEEGNFEIEYFNEARFALPNESAKRLMIIANQLVPTKEIEWLDLETSRALLQQNATRMQVFWHKSRLHVAQTTPTRDGAHQQLEVFYFQSKANRRIIIYRTLMLTNAKALVFSMDGELHILIGAHYGTDQPTASPPCGLYQTSQSHLQRIQVDPRDLTVKIVKVQSFSENNIHNMGHYWDEHNTHYLVFNHVPIEAGLHPSAGRLSIYRRHNQCLFQFFQAIEAAPGVHSLVPFKFGSLNIMEQYLVTASNEEVNVWMQQGVAGFTKRWTMKTTGRLKASSSQLADDVFPFVHEDRELRLLSTNAQCNSIDTYVAHLNGFFSKLRLSYDDYV